MQFTLATFTTFAAVATLAAATATPAKRSGITDTPTFQCNVGKLLCCDSVQPAGSAIASNLLGPLGVVIKDITAPVGITCNPISGSAAGGNSCSAQPICCENNTFNGVIAIGCSPVNINL